METFNEVFLFELEMLAERKHLSVQTVQRQLGLRSHMMSSIRDGLASNSDISYYYEKVLTESLNFDALDRFMVAFDFIMKNTTLEASSILRKGWTSPCGGCVVFCRAGPIFLMRSFFGTSTRPLVTYST